MSRSGDVTLDWGGHPERVFRLGIGEINKLQTAINCGPLGVAARCQISIAALALQRQKDWLSLSRLDFGQLAEKVHVRETLRQGLLGAGVSLPEADRLIREYVDERPLSENLLPAIEVCYAHVYGTEDEKPTGEPQAVGEASPTSPMASTASEKTASTPSARPVASPQERSTP